MLLLGMPHPNLTHLSRFNKNFTATIKCFPTSADYPEASLIATARSLAWDHMLLGCICKPFAFLVSHPPEPSPKPNHKSAHQTLRSWLNEKVWTWRFSRAHRWHDRGNGRLMSPLSSRVFLFALCKRSGWGTEELSLVRSAVHFLKGHSLRH